eukprot:87340-Chlamydomonas_euryale.AAC.1
MASLNSKFISDHEALCCVNLDGRRDRGREGGRERVWGSVTAGAAARSGHSTWERDGRGDPRP